MIVFVAVVNLLQFVKCSKVLASSAILSNSNVIAPYLIEAFKMQKHELCGALIRLDRAFPHR